MKSITACVKKPTPKISVKRHNATVEDSSNTFTSKKNILSHIFTFSKITNTSQSIKTTTQHIARNERESEETFGLNLILESQHTKP